MSTLNRDTAQGTEVDLRAGELRKADDRHDQPGQGADLRPPNAGTVNPRNDEAVREELDPLTGSARGDIAGPRD